MKKSDLDPTIELVIPTQALCYSRLMQHEQDLNSKSNLISNLQTENQTLLHQLKSVKQENLSLLTELEDVKSSLNTDSIYEFIPHPCQLSDKIEACQTLRKQAESNADFYKTELEKKIQEIKFLQQELEKTKQTCQETLKKDELKQLLLIKNEQIKSLNKKFQVMALKIDSLTKEKEILENLNKVLENDKKKITERWFQSSNLNKCKTNLQSKNRQLDVEINSYKSEIDLLIKTNQELCTKHTQLQLAKDNDALYIDKLKEELFKLTTKYQILQDERDILAKLNEELSISNHLQAAQISKSQTSIRPSDEYQFAVEMNVNLEHKLEKCQAEIYMLKHQLNRKNEEIDKFEVSSIKENFTQSKDLTQELNSEIFNSHVEVQALVDDFKQLLMKYRKCKERKKDVEGVCERMKDKVCELSAQVQSDKWLIKCMKERSSEVRLLGDSRSVSSFRMRLKEMAGNF